MPDSMITSSTKTSSVETANLPIRVGHGHNEADANPPHHHNRPYPIPPVQQDDGGNQSDSSSNSNSSLVSSPRYNERHPRVLENVRRKRSATSNNNSVGIGGNSTRGSFVMLASRTSLPPVDENNPLDATESQLALNLRRATRSTSWTNQKILDAIDGLHTCVQDLDPCFALGGKVSPTEQEKDDGTPKNESPCGISIEKFVLPKSISNLIKKSRSSGSVNPPTSNQNRETSCYNFLSGIREDEDEERLQQQEIPISVGGGNHHLLPDRPPNTNILTASNGPLIPSNFCPNKD